jgi:hypothetical protein
LRRSEAVTLNSPLRVSYYGPRQAEAFNHQATDAPIDQRINYKNCERLTRTAFDEINAVAAVSDKHLRAISKGKFDAVERLNSENAISNAIPLSIFRTQIRQDRHDTM